MATFSNRLRAARTAANLTQEELGFAVGVTKQSVSDWENGRQKPNTEAWPKLREALGVSLDHLICGDPLKRGHHVQEEPAKYSVALSPELRQLLTHARRLSPQRLKALVTLLSK